MPHRLIPLLAATALLAAPAAATEKSAEPAAAPALSSQGERSAVPAEPALAPELAQALRATDGKVSAAEREDRDALAKFYQARASEPAWVTPSGLSPAGAAVAAEIAKADDWGLEASAFRLPPLPAGAALSAQQRAEADVAISLAILKYARHARGSRSEPATLSKYLDRTLPLADPGRVMDEIARAAVPDAYLRSLHPQHPQFAKLREKYLELRGGRTVAEAAPAGPADAKKKAATPEASTLRKVLVNMEEWRWMPQDLGRFYVWVNVPEFMLRVVKDGKVIHAERVIVGKPDTQTPIFSDEMEQVIFHPFWGVPDSIKKLEIQPSLARGSMRLLERHNLRIQRGGRDIDPESVDWTTADMRQFHVYQPPGGGNVLGLVKFRFPNKHDVYMHDTPTKNLFNAQVRTFSHGCMRVREPLKLAELLLAEDKGWPASRVAAAVDSGRQDVQINLGQKFPVHITYFTAAVDDDGKLKLFGDVYDHESKIALGMEGKAHLIPRWKEDRAPVHAEPIGQLADTKTGGAGKKDWMRQVFGN